jgi:hypothetical protein
MGVTEFLGALRHRPSVDPVDLRTWITVEHATAQDRFDQHVAARVPVERWKERVGDEGSSIAWLRFHTAWHEDLAIQSVLRGQEPLLAVWRERLGLEGIAPHEGLGEAEVPDVTARLDAEAAGAYARAVHDATTIWLGEAALSRLEDVPPASERMVDLAGVSDDAVPWLHKMWDAKPAAWLVQWEAIGHPINHIGEMVAVRNRLGYGGF